MNTNNNSYKIVIGILSLIFLSQVGCTAGEDQGGNKADKTTPVLTLTSPLPSGVIKNSVNISWTAFDDNPAFIELWISDNGGSSFTSIYKESYGSEETIFLFDSTLYPDSANYKIKLTALDLPGNLTSLESSFSIDNSNSVVVVEPLILNLRPTSIPASGTISSNMNIEWTGSGLSGALLDIEYSEDSVNFPPGNSIVQDLPLNNNSGSFLWDSSGVNLSRVMLRLTVRKGGENYVSTSRYFSIDNIPPVLPPNTSLQFLEHNGNLILSWDPAVDDSIVDYYIVYSDTNNISTMADILSVNPPRLPFKAYPFLSSFPKVEYFSLGTELINYDRYWNVIAYDQADSSIVYSSDKVRGYFLNSFGQGGQLVVNDALNNTGTVIADAITTDLNNNIIVAGRKNSMPTIWRYNSLGVADSVFGEAGIPVVNPVNSNDTPIIRAIFLDTNANIDPGNYRILICGEWVGPNGGTELMLQALDVTGQPDNSFNGGSASYTLGVNTSCNGLTVDSNSNVYVVGEGQTDLASSVDVVLLKYTKSGVLDNTFAGMGSISLDGFISPNSTDRGQGITLDANNNILTTGITDDTAITFMFIAKHDNDGNPLNFTANGMPVIISELGRSMGGTILVDSQNNIIISGFAAPRPVEAKFYVPIGVWRYSAEGIPDNSNNRVSGFLPLEHDISNGSYQAYFPSDDKNSTYLSMTMDAQDNIVIAGNAIYSISGHYKPALWRINSIGQLDPNWIFEKYYSNAANSLTRAVHVNPLNGIIYSAGLIDNPPINMQIFALN